jgi:hypothetical protein
LIDCCGPRFVTRTKFRRQSGNNTHLVSNGHVLGVMLVVVDGEGLLAKLGLERCVR